MRENNISRGELCEAVPMGIVILNMNYKILWVNDDILRWEERKEEEIKNKNFLEQIIEEDRKFVEESLKKARELGEAKVDMVRLKNVKGKGYYGELRIRRLNDFFIITLLNRTSEYSESSDLKIIKLAIDHMAEGLVVTDVDGTIIYVNLGFTKITGYTYEEAIGKNPRILKSGKQSREFYERMWDTILSGKVWRGELINRRKDGTFYWEEMIIVPIKDDMGRIVNFVAVKRDITERKRLEEKIEEEREFYRNIIESSPDGIFIETLDGEIVDLNERAAEMLGYRKEELISKNVGIIVPQETRKKLSSVLEILHQKKRVVMEVFNKHKKGYLVPLELSANLVKIGEIELVIVTARDLSQRNEIEMRYRAIGEMARDAVIMADHEGRVEFWNPAAEEIFGYSQEEILGKKFIDMLIPDELREKAMDFIIKSIGSGSQGFKKFPILELKGKRKNGEIFPLEISLSIFIINNQPHGLLIARDISMRKKVEEEIRKRKDHLELLYNFAQSISSTLEIEELYRKSYEELRKIMDFESYLIALLQEDGKARAVFGVEGDKDITSKFSVFDLGDSITGWVIKNKKTLLIKKFKKEKLPATVHIVGWIPESWLGVPLSYKGQVIGALIIQSQKPNAFTEEDAKLLETLAPQLAVAIMNARLYTQTKSAKERYENLINTTIVGIIITDLDDNITFANEKFAEMLGYEVNEIVGRNIREFTTEYEYKRIREGTNRRKKGISDSYETVFLKKDGSIVYVLINASPLKDDEGNIVGTIGVNLDITERKRVEKIIREEREKYKKMMENLLVGIFIIQDEKIVYVNKVLGDMLGYSVNELTGEHFTRMVHPDMREYVMENYRKRIYGEYTPESYIVKMIRKNGDTLWALTRASIIEWEGRIADMVCVQDITEIKEMEDSLITLVKTFEEIKLAKSEDEIYDIAMRAISEILNFSHLAIGKAIGDEIVLIKQRGYKSSNLIIKLNENRGISAWVAKNNQPYYVPDVTKDPLYIEGVPGARCEYATPISAKNKVYGVLDVQREEEDSISEDERLLLDMLASHMGVALAGLEAMEEVEKARDMQELMVHIVSHDLKNPLAVLSGYIDLLREMPSEEFLDSMKQAINEANEIIERARLFSKLGRKKIDEERKAINIRKMLEEVIERIKERHPKAKINMLIEDIEIEGYSILREVFINILDNAFKYGASKVDILGSEKDGFVEIRFVDDGPGIPDNKKKKIFEPFERSSQIKGSGLGLTIVKMIVELHDGEIWVENNKPKGSVFVVRLPKE